LLFIFIFLFCPIRGGAQQPHVDEVLAGAWAVRGAGCQEALHPETSDSRQRCSCDRISGAGGHSRQSCLTVRTRWG